eukprot:4508129-Pleurochrysis_carterae.AAC.1
MPQQKRRTWGISEMLSALSWSPSALALRGRVAGGARSCLTPPLSHRPFHLPQPQPGLQPPQHTVGKGKGRGAGAEAGGEVKRRPSLFIGCGCRGRVHS